MNRDSNLSDDKIRDILRSDYLDRNQYLNNLIFILNSISKNTILALNGDWGTGKTVFVRQLIVASSDEQYNKINSEELKRFKNKYDIFYYNAWENDKLVPLESVLIRLAKELWSNNQKVANSVLEIVKTLANVGLKTISQGTLGVEDLEGFTSKYLNKYIERSEKILKTHEDIDAIINSTYEQSGKKILFVVDDLDRCKPSFAVELLEVLKHVFCNDNVEVLICANNDQFQHTIKHYYGEGFDGLGYLDRFYDLVFELPEPNLDIYISRCLNVQNADYAFRKVAADIAKHKHLSLRQTKRYFSTMELLNDFLEGHTLGFDGKCGEVVKFVLIPIALFLRSANPKDFEDFMRGKGDGILKEYADNCPLIDYYNKSLGQDSKDIAYYYHQLFETNTHYYTSKEAFLKMSTMLGFATIIDEDTISPNE